MRPIRITVVDENERPLRGAVVYFSMNGKPFGDQTVDVTGRATLLLEAGPEVVSVRVDYAGVTDSIELAGNEHTFQLERPKKHLVILIHGINTEALWFTTLQPVLRKYGLETAPAGYGMFGVLTFLAPVSAWRRAAIDTVRRKINAAIDDQKPDLVSVITHSFGTYVFAHILKEELGLRWHRVILCGSVVPNDFPFDQAARGRVTTPIMNEVGTHDLWPAMAQSITWGYGSIGSFGYQGKPLQERYHKGAAHSDFLTPEFCERFWVPFLTEGVEVPGDAIARLPWYMRFLARVSLKYCIIVAILAGLYFY